jgi:phage-related protein
MSKYQVIFYENEKGDVPAEEFIHSLDIKMRAKVYRLLTMIAENGPELREPYSKHLDDGIFELRAKVGSDISRVLYFFFIGRRIVVTNGFIKKHRKPQKVKLRKPKASASDISNRRSKNENSGRISG